MCIGKYHWQVYYTVSQFPDKNWMKNSINGEVEKVQNSRRVNRQSDA